MNPSRRSGLGGPLAALILASGTLGLASLAQAQSSIGLPPSIKESMEAPPETAAKAKKPRPKKTGEAEAVTGATAPRAQAARAKRMPDAPLARPPGEESPSPQGGLPRLEPSFDASSGRMGFGGKF